MIWDMSSLKELDDAISRLVRPGTFPLAIRMLEREEDIDPRARRPTRDLGVQVTICQAIGMARRYGWPMAVTPEDISCPLTFIPFGFAKSVSFSEEGHACAGIYTASPAAGARSESLVPRLPHGKYQAIAMAPLPRASFEPEVFCAYGNSAQIMRLVQGALHSGGGGLNSLSTGRIDCAEIIIRTMTSGEAHYILPCSGDRIFGLTEDDEMAFAAPFEMLPRIVEGLEATHKAGIRYPTPKFMRFAPRYPPQYESLREALGSAD
jgi:uncharacterized protein (DUF169 family)